MRQASELTKNIFTLSTGSIIAQLIPVVASLVLAHLYTAEQYGDWGVFLSYVSILSIVITGQYEAAIIRPEKDADAHNLVVLCLLVAGVLSLGVGVAIGLCSLAGVEAVASIPGRHYIPLYIGGMALFQIYTNYANRLERYGVIASSGILRNTVQALSRIGMGWAGFRHGLILGAVLGVWGASLWNMRKIPILKDCRQSFSFVRMRGVALRYRYFPLFQLPSSLLNTLSTNLPVILLAYYFLKEDVGYFSMTIGLLYLPVSLIGNAMSKIFYKTAASKTDRAEVAALGRRILQIGFTIGALMTAVLVAGGEQIFSFLLGGQWATSGRYAILLTPWIWLILIYSPLSCIFEARDSQRTEMWLNLVMFISRISVVCIGGYWLKSVSLTILLYSFTGMILWGIEGAIINRMVGITLPRRQKMLVAATLLIISIGWIAKVLYIFT